MCQPQNPCLIYLNILLCQFKHFFNFSWLDNERLQGFGGIFLIVVKSLLAPGYHFLTRLSQVWRYHFVEHLFGLDDFKLSFYLRVSYSPNLIRLYRLLNYKITILICSILGGVAWVCMNILFSKVLNFVNGISYYSGCFSSSGFPAHHFFYLSICL